MLGLLSVRKYAQKTIDIMTSMQLVHLKNRKQVKKTCFESYIQLLALDLSSQLYTCPCHTVITFFYCYQSMV